MIILALTGVRSRGVGYKVEAGYILSTFRVLTPYVLRR